MFNLLIISQLKRQLNVHIWADLAWLDEVLAIRFIAINVKVEILNSSEISIEKQILNNKILFHFTR